MADRSFRGIAADLLEVWTDSDTAMEVVGTGLGIFGESRLDPVAILAHDTPLRDALFDVLLSLVEGGALEMRPLDDGRYAFRWRPDIASAALARDTTTTIDMAVPAPNLAEIGQLRAERDEALRREADALGRAEFAEALAAEQKRLLLSSDLPARSDPPRKKGGSRAALGPPADPVVGGVVNAPSEPPASGRKPRENGELVYLPGAEPVVEPGAGVAVEPAAEKATKPKRTRRRAKRILPPLEPSDRTAPDNAAHADAPPAAVDEG